MKIYQRLAIVVISITLAVIGTKQVRADTVTDNFTVTVTSGNLAGQTGSGFFSYDDSFVTGKGLETLPVDSLEFDFLHKIYDEADDYSYLQGFPTVDLKNGKLLGLNYTVNYSPNKFFYISGTPNLSGTDGGMNFYEGTLDSSNNLTLVGTTTYTTTNSVPEPTNSLGTLAFVVLGIKALLRQA